MNTIIGFMGFDGTGKTTTCSLVKEKLSLSYSGICAVSGFDHLFLQKLKNVLGMCRLQSTYDSGKSSTSKRTHLFKVWPIVVFIECWLSFLYFKFFCKSPIVFFDRYFYDWLVSFEKLGYSSVLTRFLFLKCLPNPDLGLVFIADPKIAYERKKHDHLDPLSEYSKQFSRYIRLAQARGFTLVDTSRLPAEHISRDVVAMILKKL